MVILSRHQTIVHKMGRVSLCQETRERWPQLHTKISNTYTLYFQIIKLDIMDLNSYKLYKSYLIGKQNLSFELYSYIQCLPFALNTLIAKTLIKKQDVAPSWEQFKMRVLYSRPICVFWPEARCKVMDNSNLVKIKLALFLTLFNNKICAIQHCTW